MNARDQRRQAAQLVRLREVRMRAAGAALAEARVATARAEAARDAADARAATADAGAAQEHQDLVADPAEAERRLALLDQARFGAAVAASALEEARAEEAKRTEEEVARRKAMILARARHDVLAERAAGMARRLDNARDERQQMDAEEVRRFR